MAQMYEAFLYGFWAPFATQYAEELSSPSRTLDNVLQHLYIEGNSDARKDKLTEYILRLVSDNTVISGVDVDDVGVDEIRGVREWDTSFPYAIMEFILTRRLNEPRPRENSVPYIQFPSRLHPSSDSVSWSQYKNHSGGGGYPNS